MAFESNTLVNGEWTTRTLDVNTVLRHYDQQDNQPTANIMDQEHPPLWGLLTQTIIRSPLVNWILPVSLRDPGIHDVAFIGVSTFQFPPLPCLLIFVATYSKICQSLHARLTGFCKDELYLLICLNFAMEYHTDLIYLRIYCFQKET
jgi:hypothetical protein